MAKEKAIEVRDAGAIETPGEFQSVQVQEVPISAIIARAVDNKVDVGTMERLVALHERVEANKARKAFAAALHAFQGECPQIPHNCTADFATRNGANCKYSYADLPQIHRFTKPHLQKHGLVVTMDSEETPGKWRVTVKVTHIDGHSETSSHTCSTESASAMSAQQKSGNADTYATRRALSKALGISTDSQEDTDGAEPGDLAKVSDEQAANLDAALCSLGGDGVHARFLKAFGIERLSDLPAARFAEAMAKVEAKRKASAA